MGKGFGLMKQHSEVSVIISCHTQERLGLLLAAIDSAKSQEPAPSSIVVSVDHEPQLLALLSDRLPDILVVENEFERGASGNRNSGALHTSSSLVAFLDDDAQARAGWLSALIEPFADPAVVCTGGLVMPAWEGTEPRWFPEEFAWVVGASHRGLPTTKTTVRNVWSENMAVRSDVFRAVGGFRRDFGKVGAVSRPEDTDLCIRIGREFPDASIMFVPEAVVDHHVGFERAEFSFFLRRCYSEGRGKVELARNNKGVEDLADERVYVRRILPRAFATYLRDAILDRDSDQLRRAAALACGTGMAGLGAAIAIWRRGS